MEVFTAIVHKGDNFFVTFLFTLLATIPFEKESVL